MRERFDRRRIQREQELCRKLSRFTADNRLSLESSDPALPPGVFNRLADNWRPLFAIAEVAGGDWPQRVAVAFAKLTSKEDMDAQGIGVMLLADIQQLFGEAKADRIFSRDLVQALCTRSDRPWSEANRGKPITETWLAIRLRAFRVHSKDLRIGKDHAKGYETADFNESFERYLPSDCVSKRDNVTMPINTGRDPISERDNAEDCHGLKSPDAPENNESVAVSRFQRGKHRFSAFHDYSTNGGRLKTAWAFTA